MIERLRLTGSTHHQVYYYLFPAFQVVITCGSAASGRLDVPSRTVTSFGHRSFVGAGAATWNNLLQPNCISLDTVDVDLRTASGCIFVPQT